MRNSISNFGRWTICAVLFGLLLLPGIGRTFGEEVEVLSFREYLEKVSEHRAQLTSYDLTVKGKVYNAHGAVVVTTGKAVINERIPRRVVLEMATDPQQGVRIVARREWYTRVSPDQADDREEAVTPWMLNIRIGDLQLIRDESWEHAVLRDWRPPTTRAARPPHFDPMGLGLAKGEFRTGGDAETIIANYMEYADGFSAEPLGDGLVRYYRGDGNEFVVDTERGFWPISQHYTNGYTRNTFDFTLGQVDGQWVPVAGNAMSPSDNVDLELQWHSINQPLSKERFSLDEIKRRYECSIIDRSELVP